MKNYYDGEQYINSFPQFRKWINECAACHKKGYSPSMPSQIGGEKSMGAYFIKKHFRPLGLNEFGLCEQCEKALNKINR